MARNVVGVILIVAGLIGLALVYSMRPPSGLGEAMGMMARGRQYYLKEGPYYFFMLVSGLVSLSGLILLVRAVSQTPSQPGKGTDGDPDLSQLTKKCPACAEQIKLEALVCRFCGQTFDDKDVQKEIEAIKAKHALVPQDGEKLKENKRGPLPKM